MKWIIIAALVIGLVSAMPTCGNYQYHDFVWEENYLAPTRPPDTLLDNCRNIGIDKSICDAIANQSLTDLQKRRLVLDGLLENSSFPDFGTTRAWNNVIQFTNYPPDGVATRSSRNIRDAWLKIVSIDPSLYGRNGSGLLVNGSSVINSKYGFSFVVAREQFPGDCTTSYGVCGYNSVLQNWFSNGKANSKLVINSQYLIHHYVEVTHCYSSGDETICYTTCEYSYSEDRRDALTLTDKVGVKNETAGSFAFSFIESQENGLVDGWLVFISTSDFNYAEFAMQNSYIKFMESAYRIASNFTPYNTITPEALDSPNDFGFYGAAILSREKAEMNGSKLMDYLAGNDSAVLSRMSENGVVLNGTAGYRYEKIHFLVPAEELNCSFDFYSHFSYTHLDNFCNLSGQEPVINLTVTNRTDENFGVKVRFYDNRTGEAFANKTIELGYGNQTVYAVTDGNGEAEAGFNYSPYSSIVYAEFQTDFKVKSTRAQIILPSELPPLLLDILYLLLILLALYILYKLSRRVWQVNPSLVIFLLLLPAIVHAGNSTVSIQVTQSSCNTSGDLIAMIQSLPVCIAEAFFSLIFSGLTLAVQMFMNGTFTLILAVPDANWFCGPYSLVMGIIESLYTLLLMGLGMYYIIRSTDVEGRITAKKWLKNMFLMIIVLTFSFYIFQAILGVNQAIASNLLEQASMDFFSVQTTLSDFVFAVSILLFANSLAMLTFFTLLMRYLMLPFLLLLFPFAIFFYFIPITEGFGKFLLKLILLVVFMTSVDALLIRGFFTLFNTADPTLADEFIRAMAAIMAFGAIGMVNLAIYAIALLDAIQQGLKIASQIIAQAVRIAILAALL